MSTVVINAWESQETIEVLRNQGLVFRTTVDADIPEMPRDISSTGDEDLMALYSQLTAYTNFLSTQLACAFVDEREAEKKLEMAGFVAISEATATKPAKSTVTALKAGVASDPEIVKLRNLQSMRYNYRKLIEVMANNAERDITLVSRELTRRTAGATAQTRSARIFE